MQLTSMRRVPQTPTVRCTLRPLYLDFFRSKFKKKTETLTVSLVQNKAVTRQIKRCCSVCEGCSLEPKGAPDVEKWLETKITIKTNFLYTRFYCCCICVKLCKPRPAANWTETLQNILRIKARCFCRMRVRAHHCQSVYSADSGRGPEINYNYSLLTM